jgi:predicted transcriptional regulator
MTHSFDCDCGACETQLILNDPQAMADIEEGLADIAAGRVISLEEFKARIDATRL